jgi:hypothetical protein
LVLLSDRARIIWRVGWYALLREAHGNVLSDQSAKEVDEGGEDRGHAVGGRIGAVSASALRKSLETRGRLA